MLFRAQLGGTIAALFAGKQSAVASTSGATASVDAELERAVKAQLDRGTPLDDVIAKLASSLATSVAAQLGISPQAALAHLTQAFTHALQPTDTGPPRSTAERASSLVTKLRQIAELATGVMNGDTGQSIRLIAGKRSDAAEAKALPAPQPDSILRDALTALAAPASPVTTATAAPVAPAPAGDGRTVALSDPAQAIATGGDTPLGRILTRALLAGQDPPPAPVAGPLAGPGSKSGPTPGALLDAATGAGTPAADVVKPPAIDAFLQAFAAALARGDAPASASPDAGDATAAVPVAATDTAQPAMPFALPAAPHAVAVLPPAPAPEPAQPRPVDANAVVDQILRGMAIRTTDGESVVRLRLVPENLGDVSIKLIVTGNSVDASLTAHSVDAQSAIAAGQNQLAKTLADAGLKLQSFTVGLAGGGFSDARDGSRSNDPNQSNARRAGRLAIDGEDTDDVHALESTSFGPPIYSARSLPGTLSYLV